jgi:hypothetical protein
MGIALSLGSGSLDVTRPLTYVIYWKPSSALANGHAAMIIDSSAYQGETNTDSMLKLFNDRDNYVSWMGGGGGANPLVRSGVAEDFDGDTQVWKGRATGNRGRNLPSRWVALKSLDIAAMRAEWDGIRNKPGGAHWKLIDKNCATVVARVLRAGGARSKSWGASHQLVWWPTDVIRYAASMKGYVYRKSW